MNVGKIRHFLHGVLIVLAASWLPLQSQSPGAASASGQVTNVAVTSGTPFPQIEKLFLDGKISARQFQYYISQLTPKKEQVAEKTESSQPPEKLTPEEEAKAVEVLRTSPPDPAKNPPPGPAIKPAQLPSLTKEELQPQDSIEKDFSGIESKVEELMTLKKERERNLDQSLHEIDDPAFHESKSKRERLDALLRLYIHGKLSQEEYNARRKTVIAEPD